MSELKWKLTTESPEKGGTYLAITRSFDGSFSEPSPINYSKTCDGWNCHDLRDGSFSDASRMKDLRDAKPLELCVYAWADVIPPSLAELKAMEAIEALKTLYADNPKTIENIRAILEEIG